MDAGGRPRLLALLGLAGTVLLQSCGAGWRRSPLSDVDAPPRQQAQVWTGGRAHRWHALVVTADSVSGVPFTQPPDCDSCRIALARAAVDSVRLGNPVRGFTNSVLMIVGIPLIVVTIYCGTWTCSLD